jgi:hypothetical protein
MARPNDTSPEAEQVLREVYRRMPFARKWRLLGEMYRDARALHAAGVRLRNPGATPREINKDWLERIVDFPLPDNIPGPTQDQPMQSLHDLRDVVRVFTDLGIPYALGGSMASSVHGIDRYTRDADITVEPFPGKEAQLASSFGPDYYLSLPAIEQAIRQRSSFNIINTSTGFKVDVFVRKDVAFEQSAMARRMSVDLPEAPGQPIVLHTPEDIILFKLRWYRLGNESSDQQWADILGVFKVQAGQLDQAYLDQWAPDLGVADLLHRARRESGT